MEDDGMLNIDKFKARHLNVAFVEDDGWRGWEIDYELSFPGQAPFRGTTRTPHAVSWMGVDAPNDEPIIDGRPLRHNNDMTVRRWLREPRNAMHYWQWLLFEWVRISVWLDELANEALPVITRFMQDNHPDLRQVLEVACTLAELALVYEDADELHEALGGKPSEAIDTFDKAKHAALWLLQAGLTGDEIKAIARGKWREART